MGRTGIDPVAEVTLHAEGRSITSLISEQKINAEEISSFTFEDAMSFVGADYALAA